MINVSYTTRPSALGSFIVMDTTDKTFGYMLLEMGIKVLTRDGKFEFLCHPTNITNVIRRIRTETGRQLVEGWKFELDPSGAWCNIVEA